MAMGPGFYSDIGKRARDLLFTHSHSQSDHKFTITTTYSPTAYNEGYLFLADINTQLKHKNITTHLNYIDTTSNLFTTITVDEPIPGLKNIFTFKIPDPRSAKLELQYLHHYAGISSSIGLTPYPILNLSAALGNDTLAVGSDMAFDTRERSFTKYNFGASVTSLNLTAALSLNDKFDTLSASYYHVVSPWTSTIIGAEVAHSFSSNENIITIGTQYALDQLTTAVARVNNFGKASIVMKHKWCATSLITVSAEVDARCIVESTKFGLALALKQ